jgi:hypothetical protein
MRELLEWWSRIHPLDALFFLLVAACVISIFCLVLWTGFIEPLWEGKKRK